VQLLISVVDAAEVAAAVGGGAAIVDVKNPAEGSLGAPFPDVIGAVREATPAHLPVSAAIGDVPDLPGMAALAAAGAAACGVQYVKVGLLGPGTPAAAERLLAAVCRAARERGPGVRIMAATYADAGLVGALPPPDLPAVAAAAGADGCMLDTARKGDGSTLFTALDGAGLERFVAACRSERLVCALAGSLGVADLPALAALGPDIAGFRGAACGGDRLRGRVDAAAVRRLSEGIAAA
jgi:uncharacterized protein (UPF0264 family)